MNVSNHKIAQALISLVEQKNIGEFKDYLGNLGNFFSKGQKEVKEKSIYQQLKLARKGISIKKSLANLAQILSEYDQERQKVKNITIFSTLALKEGHLNEIKLRLAKKWPDYNFIVENKIDRSILGGLVLKIDQTVLDLSWKHALQNYNANFQDK